MNTCMNTSASRKATWDPSMKTKTAAPAGALARTPFPPRDEQREPQDRGEAALDQSHRPQAAPGVLALGQALEVGPGEAGKRGGHHEAGEAQVEGERADGGGTEDAADQHRGDEAEATVDPRAAEQEERSLAETAPRRIPRILSYNLVSTWRFQVFSFMTFDGAWLVTPGASVREALEAITKNRHQAVMVVDASGRLAGSSRTVTSATRCCAVSRSTSPSPT